MLMLAADCVGIVSIRDARRSFKGDPSKHATARVFQIVLLAQGFFFQMET